MEKLLPATGQGSIGCTPGSSLELQDCVSRTVEVIWVPFLGKGEVPWEAGSFPQR